MTLSRRQTLAGLAGALMLPAMTRAASAQTAAFRIGALNPITGAALVDIAKLKAEQPQIFEQGWVAINHPLASKVGYFNVANISAGLFGMPIGFLTMYIVSKFTTAPTKELQDFIDQIRQPRGAAVMAEK